MVQMANNFHTQCSKTTQQQRVKQKEHITARIIGCEISSHFNFIFLAPYVFFWRKMCYIQILHRNCGMQNFKKMQYIFWRQKQALGFHRKHDFYFTVTFARKSKYPHREGVGWNGVESIISSHIYQIIHILAIKWCN